jgi:hypothetical protein
MSQDPADNIIWGPSRLSLGSSESIAPGASKSFTFTVMAPASTGTYTFRFRMAKNGVPFGADAYNQAISVSSDLQAPTTPTSVTLQGPSTSTLILSWAASSDNVRVAGYFVDLALDAGFLNAVSGWTNRLVGNVTKVTPTGLAAGATYYARLRAADVNGRLSGNSATAAKATLLTPDVTAPTVAFSSPANGAVVTGNVAIAVSAADAVGVQKVEFLRNGALYTTDTTAPYGFTWGSSGGANGLYTWTAKAYDYAGNASSATVQVTTNNDKTAPTAPTGVTLIGVSSSAFVLAWTPGTDNVGVVGNYVYVSTSPTFATHVTGWAGKYVTVSSVTAVSGLPAGRYYARVRARDAAGNVSGYSVAASGATVGFAGAVALGAPGAEEPLGLNDLFAYPNPATNGRVTFHLNVGRADRVTLKIMTLAGDAIHDATLTGEPVTGVDGRMAYEYGWDVSGLASGTYLYTVTAEKDGQTLRAAKKFSVIR